MKKKKGVLFFFQNDQSLLIVGQVVLHFDDEYVCIGEEEQKVSLLALIDKMFIVVFLHHFQVSDADKHFDFFFEHRTD